MSRSTVADTSLQAYIGKKEENSLEGDRSQVYDIIDRNQPISGGNIARIMEKPYHSVSGRITELKNNDYIQVAGFAKNKFGNKVRLYEVKE